MTTFFFPFFREFQVSRSIPLVNFGPRLDVVLMRRDIFEAGFLFLLERIQILLEFCVVECGVVALHLGVDFRCIITQLLFGLEPLFVQLLDLFQLVLF